MSAAAIAVLQKKNRQPCKCGRQCGKIFGQRLSSASVFAHTCFILNPQMKTPSVKGRMSSTGHHVIRSSCTFGAMRLMLYQRMIRPTQKANSVNTSDTPFANTRNLGERWGGVWDCFSMVMGSEQGSDEKLVQDEFN